MEGQNNTEVVEVSPKIKTQAQLNKEAYNREYMRKHARERYPMYSDYRKRYYEENREAIKARRKQYNINNAELLSERRKMKYRLKKESKDNSKPKNDICVMMALSN